MKKSYLPREKEAVLAPFAKVAKLEDEKENEFLPSLLHYET